MVKVMRQLPCVLTMGCVIHIAFLLFGVTLPVFEYVAVIFFDYMMYLLSREFEFCLLHKLQILYVALIFTCIFLQKWDIFGEALNAFRWLFFILGLALLAVTAYKKNCNG